MNWNTFRPNFFAVMEPGFLEDAPQTFLAAVPDVPSGAKLDLQDQLADRFPNVTVLDVARLVAKFLDLAAQLGTALTSMALLSALTGFAVLFAVARSETAARGRELSLLTALGAGGGLLRSVVLIENFILSGTAAVSYQMCGLASFPEIFIASAALSTTRREFGDAASSLSMKSS